MNNVALKQVHFEGITMQIPEIWEYETEVFNEEDGTKSYTMSIGATGKDVRGIDISWGIIPEGSNSYIEACATYEEVVGEEDGWVHVRLEDGSDGFVSAEYVEMLE
jgi:hypothetical protein